MSSGVGVMLHSEKELSLVEKKKRQWAQERAEMESLCSPWGLPPPAYGFGLQQNRSRFGSTLEIRETCPVSAQQDLLPRRQRSPSLPPISNYQHEQINNFENTDNHSIKYSIVKQSSEHHDNNGNVKYRYEDVEGETSGYASDCVPQSSPEFWQNKLKQSENNMQSSFNGDTGNNLPMAAWHHGSNQEDDRLKRWTREASNEDHRPRWGDRGVAAGRLWEPREPGARLPQVPAKGTSSWVERSLSMIDGGDSQILVIDQQQSNRSMKSDATDYKTMSETQNTYLLGQNAPIEPTIKAEREYRRLKALELQAAIVQQLEDRERQKREEKERQIREEREEEERFRKQQELERKRIEDERRISEEKQKREQKRAEALRLALERAEQLAKIDKENKKNLRRLRENFDAMSLNSESDIKSMERSPRKESAQHSIMNGESKLIQNIYIEQAFSPKRKMMQEQMSKSYGGQGSTETNIIVSNPQSARFRRQSESVASDQDIKKTEIPRQNISEPQNMNLYQGNQTMSMLSETPISLMQIPLTQEIFTPLNFANNNGVQMALLVPSSMNSVYPCIQPMSMQALFSADVNNLQRNNYNMHSQTDTDEASISKDTENKILTPSKYRNCKDASTQTDAETVSLKNLGIIEEKGKRRAKSNDNEFYTNLEQNTSEEKLNSLTNKKEKRHQSEERLVSKDLENRPKWGVNKPPTQYKKQSEKDIFYTQKRKLRLRKRMQLKNYTSHSSDDNRSPSPVLGNPKNPTDKNRISLTDYHWRKKMEKQEKNLYPRNLVMETTQISPLEFDSNGIIHVNENFSVTSKRTYEPKKHNYAKNGISNSQKFTNDKYGNPKLWQSEKQDEMLPIEINNSDNKMFEEDNNSKFKEKIENKKKYNDNINRTKRDRSNYYKEQESSQPIVLDQLRSLKESLKKQQQIWGKYDTRRSPSPNNEVDLEME